MQNFGRWMTFVNFSFIYYANLRPNNNCIKVINENLYFFVTDHLAFCFTQHLPN